MSYLNSVQHFFYRPPSSSSLLLDSLSLYIESLLTPHYSNFILLGDFNVNFCSHSAHPLFSKLVELSSSFGLHQLVNEATHIHHSGSTSIIDLVFVSTPELVIQCSVIPSLCNSDHTGIEINCSWKSTARLNHANNSTGRIIWNYKLANWDKANDLINDFDWDELLSDDINKSWSNWCEKFLSIMNHCIPRRKLPPRKNLPWLSKELTSLMRKRNMLYKHSKQLGDFTKYKSIRNKVTSELWKAKKRFFQSINPHNLRNSGEQSNISLSISTLFHI